jgi:hypothetical protein
MNNAGISNRTASRSFGRHLLFMIGFFLIHCTSLHASASASASAFVGSRCSSCTETRIKWQRYNKVVAQFSKDEQHDEGSETNLFGDLDMLDKKRRSIFSSSLMVALRTTTGLSQSVHAANFIEPQSITVPLKFVGGAYLIYYRVEANTFRAVLDTGSPFLLIPGSCSANTRAKTGCYREQGIPSGLETTIEIFDGFEGEVEWRKAPFAFVNATGSMIVSSPDFVFGVADDGIMSGPGGVFFGLIKNTDARIRPSFLGQTDVTSFAIDLREADPRKNEGLFAADFSSQVTTDATSMIEPPTLAWSPSLTLSTIPLLAASDYIPMTSDLRKKYGDPVEHYASKAKSIIIDGRPLIPKNRKPIYVIFDTGVTGMVISKELFDQRYQEARERREKRLWGGPVEVSFVTNQNHIQSITAQKPLTTPFDPKVNWKNFNAHILVVGLSFLDSKKLVVDIDDRRLWVHE